MSEAVWGRFFRGSQKAGEEPSCRGRILYRTIRVLRWLTWAAVLFLLGWGVSIEARSSYLQSRFFTWFDSGIKYEAAPGASPSIHFPHSGPRNLRLGYAELATIIPSLEGHQFQIMRQAQWSPRLDWFVTHGGYALYTQKRQAGLTIYDRAGVPLFAASYPQRVYENFKDVPPLVANSLIFIEDHNLAGHTKSAA